MRLLHTADWHLGHALHDEDRSQEHAAFLAWLLDLLEEEAVDQLVVAGDVFETANPPAKALEAYYGFLSEVHRRIPGLGVVVLGGNHDSAARLEAPRDVLRALGVQVVARLPRDRTGPCPADLVIPLADREGEVRAWMVAVPYLRPSDLPRVEVEEGRDPLVEGVRAVYEAAVAEARTRREPGQALVGGGHCYMYGGETSELSERRILVGGEHALPVGLFPEDLAYVALGHLHKAQVVGGREHVRYAGSPIPLSFAEVNYRHQVVLVELEGEQVERLDPRPIPRSVELLRLGPLPPEGLLTALADLPEADETPRHTWPMLEARALLDEPEPGLRARVDEVVADRRVRLLRLGRQGRNAGVERAAAPTRTLRELRPEEVFRRRWEESEFDGEPPEGLLRAFRELLEELAS
jgi:exonuclease SbcD